MAKLTVATLTVATLTMASTDYGALLGVADPDGDDHLGDRDVEQRRDQLIRGCSEG